MAADFSHQKLRGRSFRNQALSEADFANSDICGSDFSTASLVAANLSKTKTGLKLVWALCLMIGLVLLIFITGFIVAYSGSGIGTLLYQLRVHSLLEFATVGSFTLGLFGGFIVITLRQGLGTAISAFVIVMVIALTLLAALPGILKTIGAAMIVFMGIIVGVNIAGVTTGAIANAFSKTLLPKQVWLIVQLLMVLGAIVGSIAGVVGETESEAILAGNFSAVPTTLMAISLSWYAGTQAVKGNPKYALIRRIAVAASNLGATSFRDANLTDADFTGASLKHADFRGANLTRTYWFGTKYLAQARLNNTYLENPKIRQLVVTLNGQEQNFDHMDLRGLNLQGANLADASFIGAKLSEANLQGADLTRAKLVQTQLYDANLAGACLTGAVIQDWSISTDTNFTDVKCDYVYMQLPTKNDPDPCRKPDNRNEMFQAGDFADFIAPIIKTLNLYQTQNVDLRVVAQQFKTLDLFHHEGLDPTAAAIALKQLAQQYPEAELEVVALEGRGEDKVRVQAKVAGAVDRSALSAEYFAKYKEISSLPYADLQSLLAGIAEKDDRIRSLESMVMTAMQQKSFYIETYQNLGDTVAEKGSINISAGGDIGSLSGVISGETSGVVNVGEMSGDVVNTPNQQSQTFGDIAVSGSHNTLGLSQAGDDVNQDQSKTQTQTTTQITGDTADIKAALMAIAQLRQLIHNNSELNPAEKAAMDMPIKVLAAELKKPHMNRKTIIQAMTSLKTGLNEVSTLAKPFTHVANLITKAYNSRL
jgi:uncharacterized protein YjbI with pentapeptide repeats